MRTKQVNINDKIIVVQEKRVSELVSLYNQLKGDIDSAFNGVVGANNVSDLSGVVGTLGDKLVIIFPTLQKEDIENAYPSELEELAGAFVDVNFTGIKSIGLKFGGPLLKLIMEGLQKKS